MNISPQAHLRALTAIDGVKLPAPVMKAIAAANAVEQHRRPESIPPGPRAVATALMEGRDPYTDEAVRAAVIADTVASWSRAAGELAWSDAAEVAVAHADDIVAAWRPLFDPAANDLAAAVPTIGRWAHDSAEALEVLNRGGDAAAQWVSVKAALGVIEAILRGWNALATLAHIGSPTRERDAYIVANLSSHDHAGLSRVSSRNPLGGAPKVNPWDIARAGHTLQLPTFTEYLAQSRRRTEDAQRATEWAGPKREHDPSKAEIARLAQERLSPEALALAAASKKTKSEKVTG